MADTPRRSSGGDGSNKKFTPKEARIITDALFGGGPVGDAFAKGLAQIDADPPPEKENPPASQSG